MNNRVINYEISVTTANNFRIQITFWQNYSKCSVVGSMLCGLYQDEN